MSCKQFASRILFVGILLVPLHLPAVSAGAVKNADCLPCHGKGELVFDHAVFAASAHGALHCAECHEDIDDIPHQTGIRLVECSNCHDSDGEVYERSVHGRGLAAGIDAVPRCQTCHGSHDILPAGDSRSRVFPLNVPETCGQCHSNLLLAEKHAIEVVNPYKSYVNTGHGRGLLESGLLVSAVCDDCHGSHLILPREDPDSTINLRNIGNTCGACHGGIRSEFDKSVHGGTFEKERPSVPTCVSCHLSHPEDKDAGWTDKRCSYCHASQAEAHRQTWMGKEESHRCIDCHGSHNILPAEDPASLISEGRIVAACRRCHDEADADFISQAGGAVWPALLLYLGASVVMVGLAVICMAVVLRSRSRGADERKKARF